MLYADNLQLLKTFKRNCSNINVFEKISIPWLYLGLIILFWTLLLVLCANFLVWERGNLLLPGLWLIGFAFLSLNNTYNLVCSIFCFFSDKKALLEKDLAKIPSCAILYPIKDEIQGLFERMDYTLSNNNLKNVELFLLSDSGRENLAYEHEVIGKLKEKYGSRKVKYVCRENHTERKQGNIKSWLNIYGHNYEYFFVCDADSMAPKDCLLKLLKKAEHPQNSNIAIFQSYALVAHAKTLFSKMQSIGTKISQKLYVEVNHNIFKQSLSYGHGNLIRTKPFNEIEIPKGVLSHDIWDVALLDQRGWKTAFCSDVICFEEAPSNYHTMRLRDKRWIRGNFQTYKLLKEPGLSIGTKFNILYGIYMYVSQPVFLFWMLLNILGNSSVFGQFLITKPMVVDDPLKFQFEMFSLLAISYGPVLLHKFVVCKTFKDGCEVIMDVVGSTLISLNNVVYQTIDIFKIMFEKVAWKPMSKNPYGTLSMQQTITNYWPSTLLGLYLFYFCLVKADMFIYFALPLLLSFSLSIPLVYLTSKPVLKLFSPAGQVNLANKPRVQAKLAAPKPELFPSTEKDKKESKKIIYVILAAAMILLCFIVFDVKLPVMGTARIIPAQIYHVEVLEGGFLERIYCPGGEWVEKGQVIATLRNDDITQRYQNALINHNILINRDKIQNEKISYYKKVLKRNKELYSENIVSLAKIEELEIHYLDEQQNLKIIQDEIKLSQQDIGYVEQLMEKLNVRAPDSGVILEKIEEDWGAFFGKNSNLCRIAKNDKYLLEFPVDEKELSSIRLNDKVTIRYTLFANKKVMGKVVKIEHIAWEKIRKILIKDNVINIIIAPETVPAGIKAGMTAKVTIHCGKIKLR